MPAIMATTQEFSPPYVVSADGFELIRRWAQQTGYKSPSELYFDDYTAALKEAISNATDASVEIVEYKEIKEGLESLASKSAYPVISLDRVYLNDSQNVVSYIDMTRAVDREFNDVGLYNRPGTLSLQEQIEKLETPQPSHVVLADDVIFTGDGVVKLAHELRLVGRPVVGIVAGIGIKEGVDAIEASGIEVSCVRTYDTVVDEVCQRDFLAGIPYSGRTIVDTTANYHELWSAPYFKPFGTPEEWASIQVDRVLDFSRFCLEHSIGLWNEVSCSSGIEIPSSAIPRQLRGMNENQELVAEFLAKHLDVTELIGVGEGD